MTTIGEAKKGERLLSLFLVAVRWRPANESHGTRLRAHAPNSALQIGALIRVKHAVITLVLSFSAGCARYLSLVVWPSRQARNAASACSRSSALLSLRVYGEAVLEIGQRQAVSCF
jgi:hypothetical protein